MVEPVAAPDLASLRTLLHPYAAKHFVASAIGCPSDQTVGQYIAILETNAAGHRLTGGCGAFPAQLAKIDPPASPDYWYCRIDGYTNEGGDPWHYELRVRVRKSDRKPDLMMAGCPGTP